MTMEVRSGRWPEPFGADSALTDDERRALAVRVEAWAGWLGLGSWDIRVSTGRPGGVDSWAEVFTRDDHDSACIAFRDDFLTHALVDQEISIVHELLHLHFRDLSRYVRDAVEGEVGQPFERLFTMTSLGLEEKLVDRLAVAIVRGTSRRK